jgi:hypothetical protein
MTSRGEKCIEPEMPAKNCGVETASSGNLKGYIFIALGKRCEHARKYI